MNAQHSKASQWIKEGIFDGLSQFSELETRIDEVFEEKDRGDVFEIFIEAYLAMQSSKPNPMTGSTFLSHLVC